MHKFDAIKERLRQAIDLVDLVGAHVALKRAGRDFAGLCPFHEEKTPSFYVSPGKGIFKCFGCGAGGDIFTFIQLREKVEFGEALRILADRAGIELSAARTSSGPGTASRSELAKVNAWAAEFYRHQYLEPRIGAAVREYVGGRGLTPETSERFQLGLATSDRTQLLKAARLAVIDPKQLLDAGLVKKSDSGEVFDAFRDRLMFPIRDTMGRCIGFGGRALDDHPAKYLNTSQTTLFDKSRCLYGIDRARQTMSTSGRAVIVEGYIDCLAAHQAGVTDVVATLGTAMTDEHAEALRHYCGSLVLVFDSDAAGQRAADRAISVVLRLGLDVRLARVESGKDPAEYLQTHSAQEFIDTLNSAEDALGFKWRQVLTQAGGGGNARERRTAIVDFIRLVASQCRAGVIDAIQRGLIVNQVAKVLAVRPEEVQRQFEAMLAGAVAAGRGRGGQAAVVGCPPGQQAAPTGPEQSAERMATAVILREPGLWPLVKPVFELEQVGDARLRRVAERATELAERLGEFELGELLSALDDPADAALATELALWADETVMDPAATMNDVVARLGRLASDRTARTAARAMLGARSPGEEARVQGDELRRGLVAVQAAAEQQKFAGQRVTAGARRV